MLAFQKVQGLDRTGGVGPALWSALDTPKLPHLRYPGQGDHLEVDKTQQVLMVAHAGKVVWVSPVSTGGFGRYTPEGTFQRAAQGGGLRSVAARHALGSPLLHRRLRRARQSLGAGVPREPRVRARSDVGGIAAVRERAVGEPVDVYSS